jgi:uracil-DNA glycosylase family 4
LVRYLAEVARTRKREFATWHYWARPLAGFGDPGAQLLIVGLAPAAHGGSRTGRMFTGDSSSQFLMRALHKVGLASQPSSLSRDDGLTLRGVFITNAARCAPPENKPAPAELVRCRPYMRVEIELLAELRVVVALGKIAWDQALRVAEELGCPRDRTRFAHGAETVLARPGGAPLALLGSYHPSRQNTNTGRLTEPMFDAVFARARALVRV